MKVRLAISLLVFVLAGPGATSAAVKVWDGGGADSNWMTKENWVGDVAPVPGVDSLEFPDGAAQKNPIFNNFPSGSLFQGIHFSGATGGYVLSGELLHLEGPVTSANTSGTNTINFPINGRPQLTAVSPGGTLTTTGSITLNSGLGGAALSLDGAGIIHVAGHLQSVGNVTKLGTGVAILTSSNTYTGGTTVLEGTLVVNGVQTGSSITLGGGTLGGIGTVGAITASSGTVSPGLSPGELNVGNTILSPSTSFRAELNGSNSGSGYDQLDVVGGVNLNGAMLNATLGFVPANLAQFRIINNDAVDAVSGTFADLPEGSTLVIGTRSFTISYIGGTGNDVVLTAGAISYLAGTVTSAATGAPVANTSITIFYASTGNFATSASTNSQGVYMSSALPTGLYFVRALPQSSSGLLGQLYNNLPCPDGTCTVTNGTPVAVTAPSGTPNINFALPSGGTISGTVTNATTGAPVANVSVTVYSSTGASVTSVSTNAQGVYTTITGLPTGTYFVRAQPPSSSGLLGQLYNNLPCPDGSCTVTTGTPVVVTSPNAGIANFVLPVGGTITGTVTNATTGAPVANVSVRVHSSTGASVTSVSTNEQGFYTTSTGLVTGSYFVRALPQSSSGLLGQLYNNLPCPDGNCTVTTGTPVVVMAPNAANANFALPAGGTIRGTVTNAVTGAPVANVLVTVYSSTGAFVTSVSTDAQGVYAPSTGLVTGTYVVKAEPPSSSGLMGRLYDNLPCPNGNCTVTNGTPVAVTAPHARTINFALPTGGAITGTVTNAVTGAPVADVSVDVYSSTGGFVTATSTNAEGVYTTSTGLVTGSYFVRALPSSSDLVPELYDNLPCPNGSCTVTSGTPVAVTEPNVTPNINFALAQPPPAPNDTFATALVVDPLPYRSIVNTTTATTGAEDPVVPCGNGSTQRSVWYVFTPSVDGPVVVNTLGSNYNTILAIYTGSPGSFTPVGCNDNASGLSSALTIQGTAGQRLAILVTASSGSGAVLFLNVAPAPGAFGKVSPGTGTTTGPSGVTLSWGASSGAQSYEYCLDTNHNSSCSASWVAVGNVTSVVLTALLPSTPYSWHVRALNVGTTTYAEGSTSAFWTFTTTSELPFGQVDTPEQNAVGVQGGVSVTGWALDDVLVSKVEIFRNCLAFEPGNCQTVLGHSVVYIGEAAFVPGARPDVEAAFPSHPFKHRAGWGYLLLTPVLPHVPNGLPTGGQGPMVIYAIATDTHGQQTLLGRSFEPGDPAFATPTAITMSNDTIAKPFGAIDTPSQGQTISGTFHNFGWALTPDTNTVVGDAGDIFIPTNGTTITVFIDALPVALVAYNQCRGTVGNPVPGGQFCDDDVSSLFGHATPQPPLTPRVSNPTTFRNLDAGRGAIGAYTFDTSQLANGLHTIAWSVSDSEGRTDGIGSRYFIVSNGPAAALSTASATWIAQPAPDLGAATMWDQHMRANDRVWGRTGFDLATAWREMQSREDGTYAVWVREMGRLELWLGAPVDAGYMVANGKLQPLPIGSNLEGARFGWMPPPGYVGPYEFVFVRGGERIQLTVTIGPGRAR